MTSLLLLIVSLLFPPLPVETFPPVQVDLLIDGIFSVGGEIVVTCIVSPQIESERITVSLDIPAGMTVTAGSPRWEGMRKPGEGAEIEVSVRIMQAGEKTITVTVVLVQSDGSALTHRVSKTVHSVP